MKWGRTLRTVDLARVAGLSTQQIRYYEADGMLPPVPRSPNGYRVYSGRHVAALRCVRSLLAARYGGERTARIMRLVHNEDVDEALAMVNARHAELDRDLRQVDLTLAAIQSLPGDQLTPYQPRATRPVKIGQAARDIAVEPSTLRFWESEGLLRPHRDPESGYRIYDAAQMRRLRLVALLRRANYGFDAIRSVLDELAAGKPEATLRAIQQRRRDIWAMNRLCAAATAALWRYITDSPAGEEPATCTPP